MKICISSDYDCTLTRRASVFASVQQVDDPCTPVENRQPGTVTSFAVDKCATGIHELYLLCSEHDEKTEDVTYNLLIIATRVP